MDLNLSSLIKSALILAFILPAFALVAGTLPAPHYPLSSVGINQTKALIQSMNGTSHYIQLNFLKSVSGLNTTLNGKNGSFSANPTIFQSFAFILEGFGTVMHDMIMLPYLDLVSLNFLASGLQYALPTYAINIIKTGIELLYGYMIISMILLGVSMIEKYNVKT